MSAGAQPYSACTGGTERESQCDSCVGAPDGESCVEFVEPRRRCGECDSMPHMHLFHTHAFTPTVRPADAVSEWSSVAHTPERLRTWVRWSLNLALEISALGAVFAMGLSLGGSLRANLDRAVFGEGVFADALEGVCPVEVDGESGVER